VLNAASGMGKAEKVRDRVEELFTAAGRTARITLAQNGPELTRAVAAALDGRVAAVVAGGGDGTVSTVAHALARSEIPLGILPLGTLNHFAKDLGIPLDLDAAIAVVLAGQTTRVDVGEVNGRIFLNNASLGLYPRIVRLRQTRPARGIRKWFVALWALFKVLQRNPKMLVGIEADGQKVFTRTSIVFVGNNPYTMAGLEAGTRESLAGGKLGISILKGGGRPRVMRLAWRLFTGQALRSGELDLVCVSAATIELRDAIVPVALDGEVVSLSPPLEFQSRPGALSVLVPESGPGSA
jgi:YegS/Rv2252/BmrU family lipid kinase